jgi:predicted MFS family arabinose efflux permease
VAFNAATFVLLAGAVAMVRRPFVPLASDGTIVERLVGGYRALRSTPGCWYTVVWLVAYNITAVPFMGLMPIFARAEFDGGTGLTGAFSSAQGIGAIIGGIIVTMLARRMPRSVLLTWMVVAVTVFLVGFALAPTAPLAIAAAALLGGAAAGMFVTMTAVIQRDAPAASRGRVMAMMQASMGISYGIGLMFIGFVGDAASLRVAFLVGAGGALLAAVVLASRAPDWRPVIDGNELSAENTDLVSAR